MSGRVEPRPAGGSAASVPSRSVDGQTVPPAADRIGSRAAGQVGEFHRGFELPLRTTPTADVGPGQVELRLALIEEEVAELREAAEAGDLIGIADALADIVYVAYGTAHVYGLDLDAVLDEVHSSNMTKLGADGRPIRRADGKVLKGPGYRAPDVASVLAGRTASPAGTGIATDTSGMALQALPSDILDS